MNNSRTREELFLFRDLAKTNMTEFEQLISISIGAVGKIVYDPQFTVIYCSEGISKLIGVDFIGSGERYFSSSQFIHDDDREYVYQEIGKYVNSKEPFSLKYRLKCSKGKEAWVQAKGIFLDELYEDKDPIMYMVYTDITPLVEANERLEQEIQRYQIFTEFVQECFFDYEIGYDSLMFYGSDVNDKNDQENWYNIWRINKRLILEHFYQNNHHLDHDLEVDLIDKSKCWCHFRAKGIYNTYHDLVRIVGTMKNIQSEKERESRRKEYEEKLKNKAHYDHMTGLLNRFACETIVNQVLDEGLENVTGVVIDVDNFKEINDLHGHYIGDQVLIKIGELFQKYCRSDDIAARLGGDEFFLMFLGLMQQDTIRARLQTMHQEIHNIARELKLKVPVSVSMGVTKIYSTDKTFDDIYVRADETMYQAKLSGKNTLICFNEE